MKAWKVTDVDGEYSELVYEESAGKAKVKSPVYQEVEYIDLRATRTPQFDREGDDTTPPSDAELVAGGWCIECLWCGAIVNKDTEGLVVQGNYVFCSSECDKRWEARWRGSRRMAQYDREQ